MKVTVIDNGRRGGRPPTFLRYLFLVLGLLILVGTYALSARERAFLGSAAHAQGTVTALSLNYNSGGYNSHSGGGTYHPVVDFTDAQGALVEFRSGSGTSPASYRVGQSVPVVYNPAKPQQAEIDAPFSLWGGAIILGIIGGVFTLLGGIFWIVTRRLPDPAPDVS